MSPKSILAVCFFLWFGWLQAQDPIYEVSVGGQSHDVSGNENVYRTQDNEDEGLLLRHLSVRLFPEKSTWVKSATLSASGFGASPDGYFNLKLSHPDYYKLEFSYRRFESFSGLPGISNPLDEPLIGQHVTDDERQIFQLDLEILPNYRLSPVLMLRQFDNDGDFRNTVHLGQDEFQLAGNRDEEDREIKAGFRYKSKKFGAELLIGKREYEGRESLTNVEGQGNNDFPVLGEDIYIDGFGRLANQDVDTTSTQVTFRYAPITALNLSGFWFKASPEAATTLSEDADGMLAGFDISRFYRGFTYLSQGTSDQEFDYSSLRADGSLNFGLDWSVAFSRRESELDGRTLLSAMYLDTVTLGGAEAGTLTREAIAETRLDESEDEIDIEISGRPHRNLRLWLGYTIRDRETLVDEDPLEIVVPDGQEGRFDREVKTWTAGASYRNKDFNASLIWRSRDADATVLRTDYLDRTETKFKFGTRLADQIQLHGQYRDTESENETPGIALDMKREEAHIDIVWEAAEGIEFSFGYGDITFESTVAYRDPFYDDAVSQYREDFDDVRGAVRLDRERFLAGVSFNGAENDGMLAYQFERLRANLGYKVNESFILEVVYRESTYEETTLPDANYEADSLGFFVTWKN